MKSLFRPLVAALACAWFFFPGANEPAKGKAAPAIASRGRADLRSSNVGSTWSDSPFGTGAPISEPVTALSPRELARHKKMTAGGYGTPPAYYTMGLGALQALAAKGDADAMLQLAEQYLEESRSLVSDPSYPTNGDVVLLGKGYLAAALDAGRSRAASLLAQRYFRENNIVDAYAWQLMTERFGNGNVPGIDASQFNYMNDEQKNESHAKYLAMETSTLNARARQPMRR